MSNALDQSLDLLTKRLLQARAQLRRAKRNADKKRELLVDAGNVLEYELKDAFSMETMPQKKRIRILPPPGLLPLINPRDTENGHGATSSAAIQHAEAAAAEEEKDNSKDEECCFLIHSCMGWIRGTLHDRVWVCLNAENTSSTVTLNGVHLVLAPDNVLPKLVARNTQSTIAPGQSVELYAAFTLTDDVFYSQLEHTLAAAIHYTKQDSNADNNDGDGNETSIDTATTTDYCRIRWMLGSDDGICRIQAPTKLDRALSIFYPSHANVALPSAAHDAGGMDQIGGLLGMQRAENIIERQIFHTDSEDLVIVAAAAAAAAAANEDRYLNIYGLTDRIVALCVTKLTHSGMVESVKYAPPKASSSNSDLHNFMVSLQDELGYLTVMDTEDNASPHDEKARGLVAARGNTATLLSVLLETRGK
ncbi:hypothetical protein BDB00DRAFT_876792 [Zychaea mexicana]|uniref:uncharacterized protein n=1 Tax=Zychaea mexicana TaxID=64656 RepID=UPI0022FE55BE|nr:uncharacterized protein BDB00DRAFT_876792 [Zychaea mexicana]KAI9489125.1 hypothetical protein BDB00DRAFT_876792 [Zychaea mexicana]